MTTATTFSLEEVAKHNTEEDCWLVVKDEKGQRRVYNPTKYLDDHPGGGQLLVDVAGTDCTEEFEDVGHSEDAVADLKKWEIGVLEESDEDITAAKKKDTDASNGGFSINSTYVVPVVIAVLAILGIRMARS